MATDRLSVGNIRRMSSRVKRAPGRPAGGARAAVLEAARELFAERGYEDVSTAEILARAGVSRGAMYHHFARKIELFEALYVQMEDEMLATIVEAAGPAGTQVERIRVGGTAYLRECERPSDWARICLRQSREVLGLDRWRELAAACGLGAMAGAVAAAMEEGGIERGNAEMAAAIYLAALIEAALQVADAPDPVAARREAEAIVGRLLDGLVGSAGRLGVRTAAGN